MKRLGLAATAAVLLVAPAAFAEDNIVVGMTLSQTGSLNVDSLAQQRGADMWRDQVNAAGGIKVGGKSYTVKFVTYDDQSQGSRVQQLYTRLIVQDHAQFLFGPYSSGLVATAAVISEQYGKLMVITGGAEPKTYELGNKYLFQAITPADGYLKGAVDALHSKDPHAKVAFVYSDDPFSKAVIEAAEGQSKEAGFEVVMNESYGPSTTDFGPVINKVISSGADAFMGGGHYPDSATLARQLYDQKANLKWESLLVAPGDSKFATLGPAALGVSTGSQWELSVKFTPQFGPSGAEFAKAFKDKYNIDADYHSASGYTAGMVLQHAIEQAASVDPEKVTAALNKMDVTTFFGHIKFATDPGHHGLQVAHDMVLAQWQMKDGNLVRNVVWPKAAASADLLFPIPSH
ncbi:MAG TPA: amino acid ABC transporter substrate-binding protein [Stellaceae bacterium]|nr:amino acid ABC transporter substrate-binding protein [Stellaceae bacterium]